MKKAPLAFRTISEVSDWLDTPTHVLRFWESKFKQIKPVKRAGGRRYYRPNDMMLLGGIKHLLHGEGQTIKAVQKLITSEGVKHVQSMSPELDFPKTGTKRKSTKAEKIDITTQTSQSDVLPTSFGEVEHDESPASISTQFFTETKEDNLKKPVEKDALDRINQAVGGQRNSDARHTDMDTSTSGYPHRSDLDADTRKAVDDILRRLRSVRDRMQRSLNEIT